MDALSMICNAAYICMDAEKNMLHGFIQEYEGITEKIYNGDACRVLTNTVHAA